MVLLGMAIGYRAQADRAPGVPLSPLFVSGTVLFELVAVDSGGFECIPLIYCQLSGFVILMPVLMNTPEIGLASHFIDHFPRFFSLSHKPIQWAPFQPLFGHKCFSRSCLG